MDIQAIVSGICQRYGISEAERNLVIWNTGVEFAGQFSHGKEMLHDELFWDVFTYLFTMDDKGILQYPGVTGLYTDLKASVATDSVIKNAFCKMYHGRKEAAVKPKVHRIPSEMNQWRKRLIASIGGWMRLSGKEGGIEAIKAVACRAAGKSDFNNIPKGQLVSLYNAFLLKQKDIQTVKNL